MTASEKPLVGEGVKEFFCWAVFVGIAIYGLL